MTLDGAGVLQERGLALLEGDGVDDALALAALEAGLHDGKLGGVDHEGHAADLGVAHQQVDELGHGAHALNQPIIHVDVQQVGTLLHLPLHICSCSCCMYCMLAKLLANTASCLWHNAVNHWQLHMQLVRDFEWDMVLTCADATCRAMLLS